MGEKSVMGGVVEGKFRLWIWISNCSVRMQAPRARAHESPTRTGGKPKKSPTKGVGGGWYPDFFPPQILFFL